jgi:acetyl esterase/lipase
MLPIRRPHSRSVSGGVVSILACAMAATLPEYAVAAPTTPAVRTEMDIMYRPDTGDEAARRLCRLDLHLPESAEPCPLLVWFHGGGLTEGSRRAMPDRVVAERFVAQGVAVAMADYRLSPQVQYPVYLEDAARAVAWAVAEGPKRGINPRAVFVGGHSAGGYVAAMLAMDEHLLRDAGVPAGSVAGYLPVSGQMLTHHTVRAERGLSRETVMADEASPIFHARKTAPPMLLLVGDDDMAARLDETRLFVSVMTEIAGNATTSMLVVPERNHTTVCEKLLAPGDPGGAAMLAFIRQWTPAGG